MPKKRFTEIINFRVTLDMKERLEAESRLLNISVADLIRMKLSQSTIDFKIVDISEGRLTANGNTEEMEEDEHPIYL